MRTRRRSARLAGVLPLTPLLSLPGPAPAGLAAPAGDARTAAEDAPAASSYPASSVALAGAAGVAPATAGGVEPAGGLETAKTTRPVAPGLDLDLLRPVRRARAGCAPTRSPPTSPAASPSTTSIRAR